MLVAFNRFREVVGWVLECAGRSVGFAASPTRHSRGHVLSARLKRGINRAQQFAKFLARVDIELCVDVFAMRAHGILGNEKLFGNRGNAASTSDKLAYFSFACRKTVVSFKHQTLL